jgi:cytochrome c oxidase subunit 2
MSDHDHGAPADPAPPKPAPKPGAVLIGFLVLVVGEILILMNSGISWPSILPEAISTYAPDIDGLFMVILWITLFFFVLTEGLLVYFIVKYRARGREPGKAKHTHGSHTLELAWTFVPGLILFCLAVFQAETWGNIKYKGEMPKEGDPGVEVVEVYGMQFQWHFRYLGSGASVADRSDDVVKSSELHVPAGRKILLKLQTRDVLHSFWLPNVRLKQDLLPGQTIRQWFEITPGEHEGPYYVVCAELCGNLHTTMKGLLVVHDEAGYRAWLEEQRKDGPHVPEQHPVWKFWRDYK